MFIYKYVNIIHVYYKYFVYFVQKTLLASNTLQNLSKKYEI